MRIALLGAGIIGRVIAGDLAAWDIPDEVTVGDLDGERASLVAKEHGFEHATVDVADEASLDGYLNGADVVINAAQYGVNLSVIDRSPVVDLHGPNRVHPRCEVAGMDVGDPRTGADAEHGGQAGITKTVVQE